MFTWLAAHAPPWPRNAAVVVGVGFALVGLAWFIGALIEEGD